MVAWPGTQSSLHKEHEGPIAQVPQHIGEEAEETQVRQVAATTPERSLEATSEPPSAPVVNLSSP